MFDVRKELNNLRGIPAVPLKDKSFFTQKSFQLRLEGTPTPADFFGLDFAACDAFQIGRAGYFKILAGFYGCENVTLMLTVKVFNYNRFTIQPAVRTVTPVGFFAPVFIAATLQVAIAFRDRIRLYRFIF